MTVALVALVAAVLCWPVRVRAADRLPRHSQVAEPLGPTATLRAPIVVAAAMGIVGLVLVGGPWWLAVGLVVAGVAGGRMRTVDEPATDEIPLLADLTAACLSAGSGLADALSAALLASGPWLSARGEPVVAGLRAGASPAEAWSEWLAEDRLAPLARTCVRTAGSGAATAAELVRVAARMRAARRSQSQQRVARAAVWVVLPLGLCFLPAFVVVGVVPLVISLLQRMH